MLKVIENLQIQETLIKLLKEAEASQKERLTVGVSEVFTLLDKRFAFVSDKLELLKEGFSKDIVVTNIFFRRFMDDDITIIVQYLDNDIEKELVISQEYDGEVNIRQSMDYDMRMSLTDKNKELVIETFNSLFHYNVDQTLIIPTTSKLFRVNSTFEEKSVNDVQKKWITITSPYHTTNQMVISCVLPKVLEYLRNDENLQKYLRNLRVYEEMLPASLKKVK